jgi:hypothetical protein
MIGGELLKNASLLGFSTQDCTCSSTSTYQTVEFTLTASKCATSIHVEYDPIAQSIVYTTKSGFDSKVIFTYSLEYLNRQVPFVSDSLGQLLVANIMLQQLLRLIAKGTFVEGTD